MAWREAIFEDGPRKGNPLKLSGRNGEMLLTDILTVAAKKEGGEIGIARYKRIYEKTPRGHIRLTNRYKFLGYQEEGD